MGLLKRLFRRRDEDYEDQNTSYEESGEEKGTWFNNEENRKRSRFNPDPEGIGSIGNMLDASSIKKNGV